jgi:hypothetical protein
LGTVSLDRLVGSALRRLARADFAGFVFAVRRELRVPTSSLGKGLHPYYKAARNFFSRLTYRGTLGQPSSRALYLFYDLEIAPITFDFAWSLVAADVRRRDLNLDSLHVVIVPGPVSAGRQEPPDYDRIFDADARNSRLWNIAIEMCRLLSTGCSVMICKSRDEAEKLFFADARYVEPSGYTPNSPIFNDGVRDCLKRDSQSLAIFSASVEAQRYVRRWMGRHCQGRKLVVVTLRQSLYMQDRNSDLSAWKSFVAELDEKSYHVVLIPDTDAASEWTDQWPNTTLALEACFNLQIRQAFYQCSYVSMGVNSGPLVLQLFNRDAAFAMFIKVRENVPQASMEYLLSRGFEFSKSPAFCTPRQRWVWADDTLENLQQAFSDLVNAIERSDSNPNAETVFLESDLR